MPNWYFYESDVKYGPVTSEQLKYLAEQGRICQETIVEAEDGRSASAGQVKGLVFSATVSPAPEPPREQVSDPQTEFIPPPLTDEKPPQTDPQKDWVDISKKSAVGFLSFDLTRIFGGLGKIDRLLLTNTGVVFKIYYWLFNVVFVLYLLAGIFAAIAYGIETGNPSGIVLFILFLPVAFLFWFFIRITVKFPLEFVKILIKINDFLDCVDKKDE